MADARNEVRRLEWIQLPPDIISLVESKQTPAILARKAHRRHRVSESWASKQDSLPRDMSIAVPSLPGRTLASPNCHETHMHPLPSFSEVWTEAVSALHS